MKPFLLLILFLFFIPLNAQENTNQILDSIIPWNTNKKLSWNDFQGDLDPDIISGAMTIYSIDILPKNVLVDENDLIQGFEELTCVARFYRNLSWTLTNDKNVLSHEQLHFDIAEIYARKLRKKFKELKSLNEARFSIYMEEYNKNWKNCRRFQMQYDKVTDHGRDLGVNEIWHQNIMKELDKGN